MQVCFDIEVGKISRLAQKLKKVPILFGHKIDLNAPLSYTRILFVGRGRVRSFDKSGFKSR